MSVFITTVFQPTVTIEVSDAEYNGLLKQGLIASTNGGPATKFPTLTPDIIGAIGEIAAAAVQMGLTKFGPGTGFATQTADTALSVLDADGRRSWVEVGPDGRPTPESAAILTSVLSTPTKITEGSGLAWVLVDQQGRKSELQVDFEGKLAGPFPTRIIDAAKAAVGGTNLAQLPLAAWGDSLTQGGWPESAANELGVGARNFGIGGQGCESIAARQGGTPALVTLPSDALPASGSVTLTSISAYPYTSASGTGTSSGHGTINGVPGTLTRDNVTNAHTFARDTAGTAVWTPPGTPFISDDAAANRKQLVVIWSGRNSFKSLSGAQIVSLIRSMLDYLTIAEKRFLILEIPPWVGEEFGTADRATLDAANAALKAAWPRDFVPVAQYLRGPCMSEMGLTPTAQDQADINNGLTPGTLRSDGGHPTPATQVQIGKFIARIFRQKGWAA